MCCRVATVVALIFVAAIGAGGALAQHALDNNLRVGSKGVNPQGRDLLSEIRFRNAVVTGNAPAGLSFRGSVGYVAADDFRGSLGSNRLFRFQRDSLYSGLAGRGFRGMDALRVQMQLTTGAAVDAQTGLPIVRRSGTGASAASLTQTPARSAFDPFRLRPGALRSTTSFSAGDFLSPVLLGGTQTPEGEQRYAVASPLRGVSLLERTPDMVSPALNPFVMPEKDERDAPGSGAGAGEVNPNLVSLRTDSGRFVYDDILASLRERHEALRSVPQEPANNLIKKRAEDDPTQRPETTPMPAAPTAGEKDGDAPRRFDERISELRARLLGLPAEDEAGALPGAVAVERATELARETIKGGAVDVAEIAPQTRRRDWYAEHMREAQEHMRAKRWLDAEERFTRALSAAPGEPMAAIGRINAQLAAGLFLSASVNLQQLFKARPELIPVKYGEGELPGGARLEFLREELRRLASGDEAVARHSALLLAYLGWQLDDAVDLQDGFSAIDRVDAGGAGGDALIEVLREVWLTPGG